MSKFKTSPRDTNNSSEIQIIDIPTKVISTTAKVQFTCTVSEIPIAGRADIKVAKFLISKITPIRMIVLRGSTHDCDTLVSHAKSSQIQAISPSNNETVNFSISIDRIKLQIPLNYFPVLHHRHSIKGFNSSLKDTTCTLSALQGTVIEVVSRDSSGLRTLRLQSTSVPVQAQAILEEEKPKSVKPKVKKLKKIKANKQDTNTNATTSVDVAVKNEESVKTSSEVETKDVVIKTEKVDAKVEPTNIATDTAPSGESIVAAATTTSDLTATAEPAPSIDVAPVAAAALDFNALDIDAFFNSMASELMDTSVTPSTAAAPPSSHSHYYYSGTHRNTFFYYCHSFSSTAVIHQFVPTSFKSFLYLS